MCTSGVLRAPLPKFLAIAHDGRHCPLSAPCPRTARSRCVQLPRLRLLPRRTPSTRQLRRAWFKRVGPDDRFGPRATLERRLGESTV
eukprot:4955019-Pleurochrysis_carterae.AAC.1